MTCSRSAATTVRRWKSGTTPPSSRAAKTTNGTAATTRRWSPGRQSRCPPPPRKTPTCCSTRATGLRLSARPTHLSLSQPAGPHLLFHTPLTRRSSPQQHRCCHQRRRRSALSPGHWCAATSAAVQHRCRRPLPSSRPSTLPWTGLPPNCRQTRPLAGWSLRDRPPQLPSARDADHRCRLRRRRSSSDSSSSSSSSESSCIRLVRLVRRRDVLLLIFGRQLQQAETSATQRCEEICEQQDGEEDAAIALLFQPPSHKDQEGDKRENEEKEEPDSPAPTPASHKVVTCSLAKLLRQQLDPSNPICGPRRAGAPPGRPAARPPLRHAGDGQDQPAGRLADHAVPAGPGATEPAHPTHAVRPQVDADVGLVPPALLHAATVSTPTLSTGRDLKTKKKEQQQQKQPAAGAAEDAAQAEEKAAEPADDAAAEAKAAEEAAAAEAKAAADAAKDAAEAAAAAAAQEREYQKAPPHLQATSRECATSSSCRNLPAGFQWPDRVGLGEHPLPPEHSTPHRLQQPLRHDPLRAADQGDPQPGAEPARLPAAQRQHQGRQRGRHQEEQSRPAQHMRPTGPLARQPVEGWRTTAKTATSKRGGRRSNLGQRPSAPPSKNSCGASPKSTRPASGRPAWRRRITS